jgi:hypothetical protein
MSNDDKIRALLEGPLRIVNIGLESFAADLAEQGVPGEFLLSPQIALTS